MAVTRVTVDLGNSRLKLRAWRFPLDGRPPARVRAVDLHGDADHVAARVEAWLREITGPVHAAMASVASQARETRIRTALEAACDVVYSAPDPGLEIRCLAPELVGRDRLWAARGALSITHGACIVIDAGTALTVDAVRPADSMDPGDGASSGVFLGGAIAPGPDLSAAALADGAARLPLVDVRPGVPALGVDTESAIRSGVAHGLRGAARELARRIAEEVEFEHPALVVTGGARELLLVPDPAFDRVPIVSEDLVHLGLYASGFEERT